jgi:phosphoribosyl-ATP pyrophosphohydrolase
MGSFTIHTLAQLIGKASLAGYSDSRTRKLLDKGLKNVAKKVGEEGVEFTVALVGEDRERVVSEGADLLYHFLVALNARGIPLTLVIAELSRRTREPRESKKAIP